jgi:hypothetical protein
MPTRSGITPSFRGFAPAKSPEPMNSTKPDKTEPGYCFGQLVFMGSGLALRAPRNDGAGD